MAEASDLRSEVEAAEAERQRALIAADIPALDRLLADNLIHVHSTAMVHTKVEFLAHVERMGGFIAIERGPVDIRIEGDFAVVTGPAIHRVRSPQTGEEVALDGFSTVIFRRGEGRWQIMLSQMTLSRPRH
ncbi:nuclear transport factor 2 family protein [Consotaella aegiceratis]|uniref:nuclear transport factor 2 family protein n=1 Tax=Consotaella aegiceratis TaxID=3097961 RepID=UPI002F3E3B37